MGKSLMVLLLMFVVFTLLHLHQDRKERGSSARAELGEEDDP